MSKTTEVFLPKIATKMWASSSKIVTLRCCPSPVIRLRIEASLGMYEDYVGFMRRTISVNSSCDMMCVFNIEISFNNCFWLFFGSF